MQKLSVLFIMNGIGSVDGFSGISGGDVRWIEIAKWWQRQGYDIHVLTPQAGITLCKKLGLEAVFHESVIPNDYSLKSYLVRFFKSRSVPKSLRGFEGVVYSTTEHAYDVLPALRVKEKGKNVTWAAVIHWVAPLRRKGTSLLNGVLFFLNQRIGFRHIRNKADVVLAVSDSTREQAKRIGITRNIHSVGAGVAFNEIRKIVTKLEHRQYDAVFMKRLDGTKGVFDIIDIWKDVVKTREDAKLGIIGLGTKNNVNKLTRMIENYDISNNVDILGPIYDFEKKISVLGSSKLFVLPSYEENWAIVIGEAMAAGVPVLCYSIPEIRPIWGDNVDWIPKGDKAKFAKEIIELLGNRRARNKLSQMGLPFIERYDWQIIADEEMKIVSNVAVL